MTDFPEGDELDEMIRDLAQEQGCPCGVNPDLVEFGEIPASYYGFNTGMVRDGRPVDGVSLYKEGQKWRRKLIAELKRRPEWIAEFRAARELDRRIQALCEARGWRFKPWECPPWRAPDELPEGWSVSDQMDYYATSMLKAVRLRRQLIVELKGQDG